MTNFASTKLRAFGGASVFALSVGLSASAFAQTSPLASVPTPTPPMAPANAEECATVSPLVVVCAPGTDADGFAGGDDGTSVTVEDGAQVQGEISLPDDATVTIDGDFVSSTGRAVDVGMGATVTNNGFITNTATPLSGIIRTGDGSTVVNNGIITSTQNDLGGIETNNNTVVVNNGEISLSGQGTIGVTGTGSVSAFGQDTGVSLTNSSTGIIVVGNGGAGVFLGTDATVVNDGLIQTFGDFADGVIVGDNGSVTNTGNIDTSGAGAEAILAGDDAVVVNSGNVTTSGDSAEAIATGDNAMVTNDGSVATTGENVAAVSVGDNSSVANTGSIRSEGESGVGIATGDAATITNAMGATITTTGDDGFGVVVNGDGSLTNAGIIAVSGAGAQAVTISGEALVVNSGTIAASDGRAIDVALESVIANSETGTIASSGGNAIRMSGANSTASNAGEISTTGDANTAILGVDDSTVNNSGSITTEGGDLATVLLGENATVNNQGAIGSTGDGAVAVALGDGGTLLNVGEGAVTTTGDGSPTVVIAGDATINNEAVISAAGAGSQAVTVTGDLALTNSGTISGADGRALDVAGVATITNAQGGAITAEGADGIRLISGGTLTNEGTISGDIGVLSVDGADTVVNTGTISAGAVNMATERMDAVLLGGGDDTFIQVNDGAQMGWVDGQTGNDTFAYIITDETDREFNLSGPIAGFEDLRFGSQAFDFVNGVASMGQASGVVTLTGSIDQAITIVNTAILAGSVDGSVDMVLGFSDGAAAGFFTVTDTGSISTSGDGEIGFEGGDGTTLNNGGQITTTGDDTAAVLVGADSTISNTGGIRSEGVNGVAIVAGADSSVTNLAGGTITTTGENGFGIVINGDGTVDNEGIIAVSGDGAQAVTISGEAQVLNMGTIAASGGRAIDVALASTIANQEGGVIASSGGNAIRLNAAGSTVSNAGSITSTGDDNSAILGPDMTTVNNSGTISFDGADAPTIDLGDDSAVNNQGAISATGEDADAISLGDNGVIVNAGDGAITATGEDGRAIEAGDGLTLTNSATIASADRAINADDDVTITNEMGGLINTTGDADTIQTGDNLTLVNNGTISNEGFDTKIIDAGDNLTVTNNGTITSDWKGVEGEANFTLTNNAGARIFSTNDEAVEADDAGLVVINDGEIIAPKDDAVDGGADVTITNTGLIQGGENDGLELDSGTITNSGIIESLSSDPNGDFSDADLTNRELDAGIDFDGVSDPDNLAGPETDTVTNLAGGVIRGDIGINASSGNFVSDGMGGSEEGSPANVRSQTVVNFGTISARIDNPATGRRDAVLLGLGDDEFQQWTGASVIGSVSLEGGDDTFILEGTASSIAGRVDGGMGTDTAILAGDLDRGLLDNFEVIQLGSTLGGTLNDLTISGNQFVSGDVVHVGIVNVDLGVDSLTTSGSITLEEGGVLNIGTPLDEALLGQSVLVFQDGTGFTNNGATINILDDDLLIDYTPVVGSLRLNVSAVDVLVGNSDPNLAAASFAVTRGLNEGTVDAGTFAALNALSDEAAYSEALAQALPSLSNGVAREIFETGNLAGQALERHLQTEGSGVWGQIAVRGSEKDAVNQTIDGYESDQLVFTVGGDVALGDNLRVGLLASYADIDIDDETATGARRSNDDVESIRLGAYASATFAERAFVNAEVSYLTGEIESVRTGALGPVGSEYDFDGVAGRFVVGYDLLGDENISITPTLGINAAQINFDDAREAGGFGFIVDRDDANFVEGRLGLELGAQASEKVSGFIQGVVIHDFLDDPRLLNLNSPGIGSFAIAPALREQDRFELSAGATIDVSENFVIDLGYLGDFASGYNAHSARANVRIAF